MAKKNTKEKLLETAHALFEKKGFDGVTMREIADEADVNKGLLHYYFKSKQAIFLGVFRIVSKLIYINIADILKRTDIDFDQKIELMVDSYFSLLSKHPKLPLFVLSELNKRPDFLEGTDLNGTFSETIMLIEKCVSDAGGKQENEGFQFLFSMVSMCVFPFMAAPLSKAIRPESLGSDNQFLESRKQYIIQVLKQSYQ